ncbi:histidine kinase [Streptomyces sp. TRM 70361]|uniref:histidine kinase n=1 Tax=Streptomyces sp. TRM 70361 TaxID=3116553 RepID=UPI002E7C4E61|nr:histidine kinase [Streptomyces sp. TRM 70361]MEE1940124.1 histidine kinase [Streptomyces sp. TRM 70361]
MTETTTAAALSAVPSPAPYVFLCVLLCAAAAALGTGAALRRARRASRRRAVREAHGRLVREWCDLCAHHLAAVVVSADAARRLGGRRPELRGEARTLAVRTGREMLTALRRLVAVLPPDGPSGTGDRPGRPGGAAYEAVRCPTDRMVSLAEEERLDGVAAEARSALAALRELAAALRPPDPWPGPAPEPAAGPAPLPTAEDIGGLCGARRADGRRVALHAPPAALAGLPAVVGLSAFRVVEAALGAGDTGAARVVLGHGREEFTVTVTGVPSAAAGPVADLLRLRSKAAGGHAELDPAGVVRVRLPTGPDRPAARWRGPGNATRSGWRAV